MLDEVLLGAMVMAGVGVIAGIGWLVIDSRRRRKRLAEAYARYALAPSVPVQRVTMTGATRLEGRSAPLGSPPLVFLTNRSPGSRTCLSDRLPVSLGGGGYPRGGSMGGGAGGVSRIPVMSAAPDPHLAFRPRDIQRRPTFDFSGETPLPLPPAVPVIDLPSGGLEAGLEGGGGGFGGGGASGDFSPAACDSSPGDASSGDGSCGDGGGSGGD